MRNLCLVLLFTPACKSEITGPIPGVYPLVAAAELDVEECDDFAQHAFAFSEDAQIIARGDREARLIETWKMKSQGETYVWDLESTDCVVTIPPVDAEPNFPTWRCDIGDLPVDYSNYKLNAKRVYATALTTLSLVGGWVAEDVIEMMSYEEIGDCIDGDCEKFNDLADSYEYEIPCRNRYGYRATWTPEE